MNKRQRARHPATANQRILTVPQFVAEFGGTERAAWMAIYRNLLPHRRQGHKVILIRSELEEFYRNLPGVTVEEATKAAGSEREEVRGG